METSAATSAPATPATSTTAAPGDASAESTKATSGLTASADTDTGTEAQKKPGGTESEGDTDGDTDGDGKKKGEQEEQPKDPPRLAAAKKALAAAEAKEKAAHELQAQVEAYKARLVEVGERWGEELQFARNVREAVKTSPLKAARLLGLDVHKLAAELVRGGGDEADVDDDDKPLTRRQLREEQERQQREAEDKKKKDEETKAQSHRQQEAHFLGLVKTSQGASARAVKNLGPAGETMVLHEAYAAKVALDATKARYTVAQLIAKTDELVGKRLAALREQEASSEATGAGAPPPSATPPRPAPGARGALSNKAAATKAGAKPLTKDERWSRAFEELPLQKLAASAEHVAGHGAR